MATTNQELFHRVDSWEDALRLSKGYEDPKLINSYVDSLLKDPPWKDRDSLYFTNREIELICAFQRILAVGTPFSRLDEKVRVLDIGGGNGYLGVSLRRMLPEVFWEWIVIESNACASAYSKFENNVNIKWASIDSFDWTHSSNIGLFSCSLQYFEAPEQILRQIAANCEFLVLMRLPIVDTASHILTTQSFCEGLHQVPDASWPHWFFSRVCLLDLITEVGDIIYQWKTPTESYLFEGNRIVLEGLLINTHRSSMISANNGAAT